MTPAPPAAASMTASSTAGCRVGLNSSQGLYAESGSNDKAEGQEPNCDDMRTRTASQRPQKRLFARVPVQSLTQATSRSEQSSRRPWQQRLATRQSGRTPLREGPHVPFQVRPNWWPCEGSQPQTVQIRGSFCWQRSVLRDPSQDQFPKGQPRATSVWCREVSWSSGLLMSYS